MASFDRSYATFYWSATVKVTLPCTVFELYDVQYCDLEITSCTVLQRRVNGYQTSYVKRRNSIPHSSKPVNWFQWNCEYMTTSGRYAPISTFVKNQCNGRLLGRMVKYNITFFILFSGHRLQVRAVDRCSRVVTQKRWNHSRKYLLCVRILYFHISTLKTPKRPILGYMIFVLESL